MANENVKDLCKTCSHYWVDYPSEEAIEWVDKLDDGWFKDKDEFIQDFYKHQTSLNSELATQFDNFLMRYTHWIIEHNKNK